MTNRYPLNDHIVVFEDNYSTRDINQYVGYYIRHKLGGFERDEYTNEFKYMLKNNFEDFDGLYRVFYTEGVDSAGSLPFDKFKQGAPETGECDNRKDVFDELTPIMLAAENCRAKILFPYHKADNHWLVGELVLDKNGHMLSVCVFAHDPRGEGEFSNVKFNEIEICLKKAFNQYDVEVVSQISPFTSKRLDLDDNVSSGVIVADELIKRITGESLTISTAYPVGARHLRERQISFLVEVGDDAAQTCIENLALEEVSFESTNKLILLVKEIGNNLQNILNSKKSRLKKITKLEKIEQDFYKPLISQLARKNSFEELNDLFFVLNDLITLALALGEFTSRLDYFTEAATFCQCLKTILNEKFSADQKDKHLERYSIKPTQRWLEIQEKLVTKVGGKLELLPKMANHADEYRKQVMIMRNEAKHKVETIDSQYKHLKNTNPDMDDHRNSIVGPIRDLFKHVAEQMKSLLAQLYSNSEQIMATPPPCRYAIIGLGSLALQQITPHSDFEFAILTELDAHVHPGIMAYFKNLSHLANFKTIGLGETSVPNSKFEVDLKHFVHVGINFDLGGKTPLGRSDKPYSLIKSVPEMLRYVYNTDDKTTHIDKSLTYIMEKVCYVSGDKDLVHEYQKKVSAFLNDYDHDQKICERRALAVLKEGAVEFDYTNKQPDLEPAKKKFESDLKKLKPNFTGSKGKYLNVKQEIYRLADRMVYNLGLYFGIEGNSCWDTIDKLKEKEIINASAHQNLQFAVSFANFLRLKTYFKNEAQTGEMSIYAKDSNSLDATIMLELTEEDLEESGDLFNYFYRAYPLFKKLEEFCLDGKSSGKLHFFKDELFFESDSTTKGMIYFRLNQFENALRHLVVALENADVKNRLKIKTVIGHAYDSKGEYDLALQCYKECLDIEKAKDATFYLSNIGSMYHSKGDYDLALQYHNDCLSIQKTAHKDVAHRSVAVTLSDIGNDHHSKGDYDLALQYHQESLQMTRHIVKDVAHSSVATSLNNIGYAYCSKGEYDLALKYYKECLDLEKVIFKDAAHTSVAATLSNIGYAYHSKGDNDSALQYHKEGLRMYKSIFKELAHPDVAASLNNIGLVYHSKGDYGLALEYYMKNLKMQKAVFKDSAHPSFASTLSNIGLAYKSKGEYDLALLYLKECLEMRKTLFADVAHPSVATTLHNIGNAYNSKGEYDSALQHYKQSIDMGKAVYKDVAHPDVAITLNNIGNAYTLKGDYNSALHYYQACLETFKAIFKDAADSNIANSLNSIGNTYHLKGDYDLALKYQKQSLETYRIIFKDTAHPSIASSLNSIGSTYYVKGEYDSALQYYKDCLEVQTTIFKDAAHPDVSTSLTNIGNAYDSKGDYASALRYHKECLEMLNTVFKGVAHPSIANTLNYIGRGHYLKAQYDLALQYYKESLDIYKTVFTDVVHQDVATALNHIGHVYNAKGEYDLALKSHHDCLEMYKVIFKDAAHSSVAATLNYIGHVHQLKGEYDLALQYLLESSETYKAVFKGIDHPNLATSLNNLGNAYNSKGNYDSALQYYKASLKIYKAVFKDFAHPSTATALNNVGNAYYAKGEYNLALVYHKGSLEMFNDFFKDVPNTHVATSLNNIGSSYRSKGDYDLALQYYKESLEIFKAVFKGKAHPDVAESLKNIGNTLKLKGKHKLAQKYFKESMEMKR